MAEGYDNNKLHYIRWRWSSSTHHKTEFKLGLKRLFRRNNKGWGGNCILEWHLAAPHQPLKWFPKVSQCEWVKSFSVNASCWGLLGNSSIQVWDGRSVLPCVYALLSLTWGNGTCSNNSGGTPSLWELLKMLISAATLGLMWILFDHEVAIRAVPTPQEFFSCPHHQEMHVLLPWGLNTLNCNNTHLFTMPGCMNSHLFRSDYVSLPNVFLLAVSSNTKAPQTLPLFFFYYGTVQPHQ